MIHHLRPEQRTRFTESFNRSPFTFDHSLHESPAWDLASLIDASKRLPRSYYSTDDGGVNSGWREREGQRLTLVETMSQIGESQSLVLLKGIAEDPQYAELIADMLAELEDYAGVALRSDASVWRATVIVGSPNRVTPYHMDGEANFLFQLRGEKIVNVFDQTDRYVLPDVELENFYAGDASAARYKPDTQSEAFSIAFPAGSGVHIPLHAPHWVQNGNAVSIAVSVNCTLRSSAELAQLYRFNHLMRKSGIEPARPGASYWQDKIKLAALGGLRFARNGRADRSSTTGMR